MVTRDTRSREPLQDDPKGDSAQSTKALHKTNHNARKKETGGKDQSSSQTPVFHSGPVQALHPLPDVLTPPKTQPSPMAITTSEAQVTPGFHVFAPLRLTCPDTPPRRTHSVVELPGASPGADVNSSVRFAAYLLPHVFLLLSKHFTAAFWIYFRGAPDS